MAKQVTTLEQLRDLAEQKKAVIVPSTFSFTKPRPAAFIIELHGADIVRLFSWGMYVYEPSPKGKPNEDPSPSQQ